MSTFTEWNGPGSGRGPSTKDVLALIDAYNNLNSLVAKHIASTATDDVHSFNTALQDAITSLQNTLNSAIATKAESSVVSSLASDVSDNTSAINVEASRAKAAEDALQSSIDAEAKRAAAEEESLKDAIDALEEAVKEFKEEYNELTEPLEYVPEEQTLTISSIVAVTEYLIGMIKVRKLVDFIEWTEISAQFAGTGTSDGATKTHGIYILGRLSEEWDPDKGFTDEFIQKGARAYIKYVNDQPFDLIVDMTASGLKNGSITCTASFNKVWTADDTDGAWEDVSLHLLVNTDSSGKSHVYLGISARGLYGQPVHFHIAGVNFIAGGTVNGIVSSLGFTRVEQGFNAYRAQFDDLRLSELHDKHGDDILRVYMYSGGDYEATKDLYIASSAYNKVYFYKRPYVIFTKTVDGTEEETVTVASPVLTLEDLDALSRGVNLTGIIVLWGQWEDYDLGNGDRIKRAINYPDGWLACDGSTVSTSTYPNLIAALGLDEDATSAMLPIMDFAIIRVSGLFDNVELDDGSDTVQSMTNLELTNAVNQLQDDLSEEAETRAAADAALAAVDEQLQQEIDRLDEEKAEVWEGSKDEFDADKDSIDDGTIVLSPDDLNH